jgi:uncharacterized protein YxjI
VGQNYLISRKQAFGSLFAIADDAGIPQFEVNGSGVAFSGKLSVCDIAGAEVAVISSPGLGMRHHILTAGREITVSPRGFFGCRFEIDSPAGLLRARGNFSGRQYSITRGGIPVAEVRRLRTLRVQFAVELTGGEDALPLLAVVLAIELIRGERQRLALRAHDRPSRGLCGS